MVEVAAQEVGVNSAGQQLHLGEMRVKRQGTALEEILAVLPGTARGRTRSERATHCKGQFCSDIDLGLSAAGPYR